VVQSWHKGLTEVIPIWADTKSFCRLDALPIAETMMSKYRRELKALTTTEEK